MPILSLEDIIFDWSYLMVTSRFYEGFNPILFKTPRSVLPASSRDFQKAFTEVTQDPFAILKNLDNFGRMPNEIVASSLLPKTDPPPRFFEVNLEVAKAALVRTRDGVEHGLLNTYYTCPICGAGVHCGSKERTGTHTVSSILTIPTQR